MHVKGAHDLPAAVHLEAVNRDTDSVAELWWQKCSDELWTRDEIIYQRSIICSRRQ